MNDARLSRTRSSNHARCGQSSATATQRGRAARSILALGLAWLGGGCNDHPLDEVEMDSLELDSFKIDFAPKNKVDVLLVIDNSGSMGEEQANLAANFGAFVDELQLAGADYRLAVTTTDMGNVWCAGTTPERGAFQASSCRGRLEHFVSASSGADVSATACTDICELDDLGLLPTPIDDDGGSALRPWIQSGGAVSNLPQGVDAETAFRCMGPQGIDGCGFESPLEALRMALLRTQSPAEPEYGFLREDAALSVVIVTDEVDCSVAPGGETIFDQNGARTFWSNPSESFPTSAVCWNAGVKCSGDATGYTCESADKRADGSDATDPQEAVLRPVDDYVDLVYSIIDQSGDATRKVHVALLGGVPTNVADVGIPYADSSDPEFQKDFGIGAGCTGNAGGATQTAVPPVRLRDFARAFADDQIFSVCDADYTASLKAAVSELKPGLNGACLDACLEDTDAIAPGIQPDCNIFESADDFAERAVPTCVDIDGTPSVPDGAEVCVRYLGDFDGGVTPGDASDDASAYCSDLGVGLEVIRADGVATPKGSKFTGSCAKATRPTQTCG